MMSAREIEDAALKAERELRWADAARLWRVAEAIAAGSHLYAIRDRCDDLARQAEHLARAPRIA